MHLSVLPVLGLAAFGYAAFSPEQCGASAGNQICPEGQSCSQYGWCGTTSAYTDRTTCQPKYSGVDSICYYVDHVPNIDVCGAASNGTACPGAGSTGYFYRCCSSHGHCGPKNNIQDESLYCSESEAGCQPGYGSCSTTQTAPKPQPNSATIKNVANGDNCGPIVNAICGPGLCCSGSNYCGTGDSFCGSDNWCQATWSAPGVCYNDPS